MMEGKWKENGPSATQAADINIQEGAMNTKIKITLWAMDLHPLRLHHTTTGRVQGRMKL